MSVQENCDSLKENSEEKENIAHTKVRKSKYERYCPKSETIQLVERENVNAEVLINISRKTIYKCSILLNVLNT